MNKRTLKLLETPVSQWPQALNSHKGSSLQDVEAELSALVQRAALLHAYVSHRYNTGCGDQGHDASAKKANAELVKIRRAMGFSYPQNLSISIS